MTKWTTKCVFDAKAQLGEGPVWDMEHNCLWWVDIVAGKINQYNPDSGFNRIFKLDQTVSAAVLRKRGGLVLALQDGIAFLIRLQKNWSMLRVLMRVYLVKDLMMGNAIRQVVFGWVQ